MRASGDADLRCGPCGERPNPPLRSNPLLDARECGPCRVGQMSGARYSRQGSSSAKVTTRPSATITSVSPLFSWS